MIERYKMAMLKNRLSKLENKLSRKVTIEDILKVMHDRKKGIDCEVEWRRIQTSKIWKRINKLF